MEDFMKNKHKISVVMPVYNEAYIIEETIRSYYNELKGKIDFEMIIVEDGSTDNTKEILKRLEKELPIRIYLEDKRKGFKEAIKDALKYPKYNWVFVVDSDYQFDPIDFWKLYRCIDRYDIILGKKVKRNDPLYRIILSKGFNLLLRLTFKVPFWDMDTGFKLLNKKAIDEVSKDVHQLSYFVSEFVVRSYYKGFKIIEVPVIHHKRKKGSSNVFPIRGIPAVIIEELVGVYKLKKELGYKRKRR